MEYFKPTKVDFGSSLFALNLKGHKIQINPKPFEKPL